MLDNDYFRDEKVMLEYLKYEIRKFTIHLPKSLAKEVKKRHNISRKQLNILKVVLLITITTYSP